MSLPRTLVIRDADDEKTLVDVRLGQTPSRWSELRALIVRWRRKTFEKALGFILILGMSALAYQQTKTAQTLRAAIDALSKSRPVHPAPSFPDPEVGGPQTANDGATLQATRRQISSRERETLENQGAALLGSNDFASAVSHYRLLSELFPEDQVFRDILRVLRTKLKCDSNQPESDACH
ncbi:MAG: hypothetical protein WBM46_03225 [Polyangiales bacterium]